jgi:hypothetical protein
MARAPTRSSRTCSCTRVRVPANISPPTSTPSSKKASISPITERANFGGGRFFDYTAYGDTINVAARLETANKQLGTRVCVSATLAAKVIDFRGPPVGDLVLRGKTEALPAFQPLRRDQFDDLATNSLLEAFANSKRMIPQRWRHLPRMSANALKITSPAFT